MDKLTISEVMVKQLELAGIKRIYGLIGDSLNRLGQAVRNSNIDWVAVRHEEVAAYAAAGEAEVSGKLTVCAGTCGPGSIHLINGLYEANRNQAPVLAIVSHIPSAEIGFDYFQYNHPERLFVDCSVFCEMLVNPAQMPRILFEAMQTAISRQGVAVLIIPGDLMESPVEKMPELRALVYQRPTCVPDQDTIAQLAELLNRQQKVAFYCGYGCRDSMREVVLAAKLLQAPCMYTMRSHYFVALDNPYAVGMNGYLANGSAKTAIEDCDCLVLLGTDYPYNGLLPKTPFIIQIDADGTHIGRRSRVDFGVIGDLKITLQKLLPLLQQKNDSPFLAAALTHAEKVKIVEQNMLHEKAAAATLEPEYLTSQISKAARDDAIFLIDVGLNDKWAARFIEPAAGRMILGSFKHGTMAAAVGEAIGISFAMPQRQIIILSGDGGLTMLLGDLLTINQYRLPLKIIVYNNGELGYINFEAQINGYIPFATGLDNPDFAQIAEAMGFSAFKLVSPADIDTFLPRALDNAEPVLIDARTNPAALGIVLEKSNL